MFSFGYGNRAILSSQVADSSCRIAAPLGKDTIKKDKGKCLTTTTPTVIVRQIHYCAEMTSNAELLSRLQRFALNPNVYNDTMKQERGFKAMEPIESSPTMQIRRRDAPNPDRCIGIGRNGARELAALAAKDNRKKTQKEPSMTDDNNAKTKANMNVNASAKSTYTTNAKDQLFWCLMMIVKSWEEADLPDKGERFMMEASEKTTLTELLGKSESIPWKEMKLSKTNVCNELGASINKKINVDVMRALAFLYEKNIAYVWGKGCCVRVNGARALPASEQKWHVIKRSRMGYSLASDAHAETVMNRIDIGEMYIVEDPNKPLMAASGYKIGELQELANKLDVCINREGGEKPKLKKDLYQDIVTAIHKID